MKADSDYLKLPEVVEISGTGIPKLTAKLIMRTDEKAMYERWDNVWEVFRIKIQGDCHILNRFYPKHEVYPGNEDFGATAWCFSEKKWAIERYNKI